GAREARGLPDESIPLRDSDDRRVLLEIGTATRISLSRGPAYPPAARRRFTRSTHPELVEEYAPLRVVLVVADATRDESDPERVLQEDPRRLLDDVVVGLFPESRGRSWIGDLKRAGAGDLGVDPMVAELGKVRVVPRALDERA